MAEEFKILAEHFADKDNIRIVLKGTEAKSDPTKNTIYLPEDVPEEMFGVTLATLLHEAARLKHTTGLVSGHSESPETYVMNLLEDIRIDIKNIDKYPNAKGLYADLLEYYETKYGEEFKKLPKEVKILREVALKSYGHNALFDKFRDPNPEVADFVKANAKEIDEIIGLTKKCKKTPELVPVARRLMRLVFSADMSEMEKQFQEAQQAAEEAAQQDQEAAGKAAAANKELSEKGRDVKTKMNEADAADNEAEYNERQAQSNEAEAGAYEKAAEERKQRGQANDAHAYKIAADNRRLQAKQQREDAQHRRKLAAEKRAVAAQQAQAQGIGDLQKQAQEAYERLSKTTAEARAFQQKAKILELSCNKERLEKIKGLQKIAIGFGNIDKNDFIVKTVKISQTLEERLLEFLKNKQERSVICDDGKIVPIKLPTFYNPDTLFEQKPDDNQKRTRIFFLVDRSGSMNGAKYTHCTEALINICDVIEKGISYHGMDLEYAIYGFDDSVYLVKDFEQAYNQKQIAAGLSPNGGTDPTETIKTIENVICDSTRTKEFVFFITDGDMPVYAYEFVRQQLGGKKKWVFIGMDINTNSPDSKALFGNYNIRTPQDIQKVLTRAIEDTI